MNHQSFKLLLSARDPGTANNMIQIAKAAIESDKIDIVFYADEPAYSIIQRESIPVERYYEGVVLSRNDPGVEGLHKEAAEIIRREQPDAVLAGISGPGAGIDEALLANSGNIPSFAIQDFWGRVNNLLGGNNASYFVIDNEAAQLSQKLHQVKTIVTGMPKYAAYSKIDTVSARKRLQKLICHKPNERIITFFGQDHWHLNGYSQTLKEFAMAVHDLDVPVSVFYRKHPKEPEDCIMQVCNIMSSVGVVCRTASEFTTEEWLVVSDVVCSVCSNSGYDKIMLNRVAKEPLGSVVYLLYNPEIVSWYRDFMGIDFLPSVRQNLALGVQHVKEVGLVLSEALLQETQQRQWLRIQESIPAPDVVSDNIMNIINQAVRDSVCSVKK
jgi:hypothetical protein